MATGEKKHSLSVTAKLTLVSAILSIVVAAPCTGQTLGSGLVSSFPLNSLERYIGPLVPPGGIGATFRSEVSAGPAVGVIMDARLRGTNWGPKELQGFLALNEYPIRCDVNANLRFWRLGILLGYSFFETVGDGDDPDGPTLPFLARTAKIDITGFRLGGSFDVVQLNWLTAGVAAEHHFFQPGFSGIVPDNNGDGSYELVVRGAQPTTVRPYLRYVPPDILGMPLHLEAFYNIPIGETQLSWWGASLVFRPQIYRFDVAAKLTFEKKYLSFEAAPELTELTPQRWTLDMEWNVYGLEFAVYF
jgi:hypothetical protein